MQDSIFTKIIKGEIPSYKIYENELVVAFLDINPITQGHTLVVPKKQVEHFEELDEDIYTEMFLTVKKVAHRIKSVTKAKRVCVRIEGFDVPHVHVHVYPCNTAREFYGDPDRQNKKPDFPALEAMAQDLMF